MLADKSLLNFISLRNSKTTLYIIEMSCFHLVHIFLIKMNYPSNILFPLFDNFVCTETKVHMIQ